MRKDISEVWTVVLTSKPHVPMFVHVNFKWVPVVNDDPDSEVELSFFNQHRILDVLLNNPTHSLSSVLLIVRLKSGVTENLTIIVENCDLTPS